MASLLEHCLRTASAVIKESRLNQPCHNRTSTIIGGAVRVPFASLLERCLDVSAGASEVRVPLASMLECCLRAASAVTKASRPNHNRFGRTFTSVSVVIFVTVLTGRDVKTEAFL